MKTIKANTLKEQKDGKRKNVIQTLLIKFYFLVEVV